jgi:hypothetical protein
MNYEEMCALAAVALCRIPVKERTTDYESISRKLCENMVKLMPCMTGAELIDGANAAINKGRTGEKMVSNKATKDYAAVALTQVPEQLRETDLMFAISLYAQMDALMCEYTPAQIRARAQELLDGEVY